MTTASPPPVCLLLRGLPCVGKSTLGLALARRLGFSLLIKDDVRAPTLSHDMATRARLLAAGASEAQAALVDSNAACYGALNAVAVTQISAGARGCVLDSPLGRAAVAGDAVRELRAAGAVCVVVDCVLDRSVWVARLEERRKRGGGGGVQKPHAVAHAALPDDPVLIESHYPDGMQFDIDGIELGVRVDCALPVEKGVETVVRAIGSIQNGIHVEGIGVKN